MNKQIEIKMFPLLLRYQNMNKILLWNDNEDNNSSFLLNNNNNLVSSDSIEKLQLYVDQYLNNIVFDELEEIDYNDFWHKIKNLRKNRGSSKRSCEILIDGWNIIEDLLKTYNNINMLRKLKTPIMDQVYGKLFYGMNLPSLTPKNRSYTPVWLENEIKYFKQEMKEIWKFIESKVFNV